jgi:flagellar hook-associated protein 2
MVYKVMGVTISGTFSGLDVSSIISTLIQADSIPITNLQTKDTTLSTQSTALSALGTSLGNLSVALQALAAPGLFQTQTATLSNPTAGTATTSVGATAGSTNISVTQLASATVLTGGEAGGAFADSKLTTPPAASASIDSVLNESSISGQTFTVNGKQITLSDSDTLSDVINKINSAGAGVTASYDDTTGDVSLSSTSSSPIILGSAADTSDFLQQAELFNTGTTSVTSSVGLGRIDPDADLSSAGLRTAVTPGTFTINGISVNYSAGESLNDLISSINSSAAGVTATYDTYDDQMVLSSSQRGPQSITVADGTGNLATALRLTTSDSQLSVGQATLFSVNGGATRQSDSSVLTSSQLGIAGVNFTATATGSTQLTVAPDVNTIGNAINAFVTAYNSTQGLIASDMYVDPTDSTQDGPLATDSNLTFLAPQLREITTNAFNSTSAVRMLSDLGVDSNANDNTLTDVDATDLQNALTNNLSNVEALFNDPTGGLTTTLQNVLDGYNDSLNGVLVNEEHNISDQITYNQTQISTMQEVLNAEQTTLENEFAQLDTVEANAQSLSGIINGSSSSGSSGSLSSLGSVGSTADNEASAANSANSSTSSSSSSSSSS